MRLQVQNLSGGYGDTQVLRDIAFDLAPGRVLGVIGRNGTGKTTLARLIGGALRPAAGRILLDGRDIAALPPWDRARAGISVMPQTDMVFDALTVAENLALMGRVELGEIGARFPRITERLGQLAGSMSGGERKILGFARALLAPSRLILLDEPSEGVQTENIAHMQALIAAARARGAAIMLLEQNIAMVEALADAVIALDSGRITHRAEGPAITRAEMLRAISL